VDFAHLVTSTIRKHQPDIPIGYQASPFFADWTYGGSVELSQEMDWLWADIYRDKYGFSLYAKLFEHLGEKKTFEYLSGTAYPDITEHVITLNEDEMRAKTFSAFINDGAMVVFIDAIDPAGTLHLERYKTIGKVFSELKQYEKELNGKFLQDVGIYYSFDADFDFIDSGHRVPGSVRSFNIQSTPTKQSTHMRAAVNLAKSLNYTHIPFGVVTRKNLEELFNYQIIVLPNVRMMRKEEVEALKSYVERGGSLFASKNTSIITSKGKRQSNFLLSELFGVSYLGETKENLTYVAPKAEHRELFPSFSDDFPVTLYDSQVLVKANEQAKILGTITLPYTDPTDSRYASILTDPPGIPSEYPSIVLNHFGKGMVLYTAGAIETWNHDSQREVLIRLLKQLASKPLYIETDAPKSVEITLFKDEKEKKYLVNLLDVQQELPNIPIHDMTVKLWLNQDVPKKLIRLPDGGNVAYEREGDSLKFKVPVLKDFSMFKVFYE